MKTIIRTLFVALITLLTIPVFSQDTHTTSKTEKKSQTDSTLEKSGRAAGLRKLTNNAQLNWDFDINIDEEALEANIELAVENAMESVEEALENLDVRLEAIQSIEPIEVNIPNLEIFIEPIEINIPDLNIDIGPIELNLDNFDTEMDIRQDWNDDEGSDDENIDNNKVIWKDDSLSIYQDKVKEKDKNKSEKEIKKSDKKSKDKSKGLKKIK